jgi:hypothetical protein
VNARRLSFNSSILTDCLKQFSGSSVNVVWRKKPNQFGPVRFSEVEVEFHLSSVLIDQNANLLRRNDFCLVMTIDTRNLFKKSLPMYYEYELLLKRCREFFEEEYREADGWLS